MLDSSLVRLGKAIEMTACSNTNHASKLGLMLCTMIALGIPLAMFYWVIVSEQGVFWGSIKMFLLVGMYFAGFVYMDKKPAIAHRIDSAFRRDSEGEPCLEIVLTMIVGGIVANILIPTFWIYKLWMFGS
ncbi:hypothetical protein [Vibrio owensii]|uniref:hypothetical protein n=1 Tax=Vibrio harveyi group TaxID=717610 RepID=UPI003CC6BC92